MSDDGQIIWEDPGGIPQRGGPSWINRLLPLMDQPGRWARCAEVSRASSWTVARQLREGLKGRPPGRWEFAARGSKTDPRRGYVYARYLGPEDDA